MINNTNITNYLLNRGFSPHYKGFFYCKQALHEIGEIGVPFKCTEILKRVGEVYNSTPSRIERAIRTLIHSNEGRIKEVYKHVPSVHEFLSRLYLEIAGE